MDATRTLSEPEELKALAHPLRQRILEAMIPEPITTKQVSDLLEEKPTRLYHHVDALESAGLIRLIRTRPKRGTTEKYYQAVARRFVVDRTATEIAATDGSPEAELDATLSRFLDDTADEIRAGIARGAIRADEEADEAIFIRTHVRATPSGMARLMEHLEEWIRECQATHDPAADLEHGLTVAFYPVISETEG